MIELFEQFDQKNLKLDPEKSFTYSSLSKFWDMKVATKQLNHVPPN